MEWQPIETAPQDGSSILIHIEKGNLGESFQEVVHWTRRGWENSGGEWPSIYNKATHWIPLPAPPQ